MLRTILSLTGALVIAGTTAAADIIIYFDEDGGAGNPRGLYNFDPATGISTLRTTVGGSQRFFSLTQRPSTGTVYAIDPLSSQIYTMDIDTGATSFLSTTVSDTIADIAFDPISDTLYGLGRNSSQLWEINPDTGNATLIGNAGPVRAGITFSASGIMYGLGVFNGDLYTIDPATAGVTFIGGSGPEPGTLEDADMTPGNIYFTDFSGNIFRSDPATGARTLLGNSGMGNGLVGMIAIPAPATGLFFIGAAAATRRRRI